MERRQSGTLFGLAQKLFPGGVNSPVRAFKGVGGTPVFFERGEGAWLQDVDQNRYVDFVGSWGPLILGHAHPHIVEAISRAARNGTTFGAPHAGELALAERIQRVMPSLEKLRFTSSGTEATASALRLARGFTGRELIVKFEGCYHGASDALLVKAGSGVETLGLPDSAGVPPALAHLTVTLPFNDLEAAERLFQKEGKRIAGVIVEPIVGNMGVWVPREGYLHGLQTLCSVHGALLIVDEVMTGFRVGPGGAQGLYGLRPDLTTLGKIVGGGLPVGCYGGRADVMAHIAPEGNVYQAGTLSGNPVAMAAGVACLDELAKPETYARLELWTQRLVAGLSAAAAQAGVTYTVNRVGSMWTGFFAEGPIDEYRSAKRSDTERYGRFFHAMLDAGVYLPPSQFEAAFVSLQHGDVELTHTLEAAERAFRRLMLP